MKISKTLLFFSLFIITTTYTADADELTAKFVGLQVNDAGVITLCDRFAGMAVESDEQVRSDVKGAAQAPWGLVQNDLLEQLDTKGAAGDEQTLVNFRERVVLPVMEALEMGLVRRKLQFDRKVLGDLLYQVCPFLEWGFRELCSGDLPGSVEPGHYDSDRISVVKAAIDQQLQQRERETSAAEMDCK